MLSITPFLLQINLHLIYRLFLFSFQVLPPRILILQVIMYHHKNGGKTIMSNMVMVRREHNRAMGTMDLEDYRKILDNAIAS